MIDVNRHIPGTIKVEGREFLYILDDGEDFFVGKKRSKRESLFSKITCLFFKAKKGALSQRIVKFGYLLANFFMGYPIKETLRGGEKG